MGRAAGGELGERAPQGQGSNPSLPHCRQILYQRGQRGIREIWVFLRFIMSCEDMWGHPVHSPRLQLGRLLPTRQGIEPPWVESRPRPDAAVTGSRGPLGAGLLALPVVPHPHAYCSFLIKTFLFIQRGNHILLVVCPLHWQVAGFNY